MTNPRRAVNDMCAGALAGFQFHLCSRPQDPLMPSKDNLLISFSKGNGTAYMYTRWENFCTDVLGLAMRAARGHWDPTPEGAKKADNDDAAKQ